MRLGIAAGPVLLLLWQVAPIEPVRDSAGRVKLSFGYGAGQFERRDFSCDGNLVSATRVPYKSAGAQLDVWPRQHFRVTGFGGRLSSDDRYWNGAFGGVMAALETRPVGVGAGVALVPLNNGEKGAPTFYLRLGNIDRIHFRTDLFNPEPAFGTTGVWRMGLASKQGLVRGKKWFAGLSVPLDASEKYASGAFGEFSLPVGRQVDLTASAALRAHAQNPDWGLAFGLRYNLNP